MYTQLRSATINTTWQNNHFSISPCWSREYLHILILYTFAARSSDDILRIRRNHLRDSLPGIAEQRRLGALRKEYHSESSHDKLRNYDGHNHDKTSPVLRDKHLLSINRFDFASRIKVWQPVVV